MIKNDDKEQRNIKLAADHEVRQLLDTATHNWKVAQSRMSQIVQEREDGIYDDNGVEIMAVYARMERVYACITDLLRHPQAFLLPSVINGLRPFLNDESMDAESTRLLTLSAHDEEVKTVDFWKTLKEYQTSNPHLDSTLGKKVETLLTKHVMPYLADEDVVEVLPIIIDTMKHANEVSKDDSNVMNFFHLGGKVSEMAADNRPQMAMALLMRHLFTEIVCNHIDRTQQNDTAMADVFEKAKQQLLESEGWREYWSNHKRHLERKGGSLDEQWKLFYLAKKDAIARETERLDKRRETMEVNAPEAAIKQTELPAELLTEKAQKYWKRLREAGFIVADGYALAEGVSANQAAFIADCMAGKLRLMYKWKPFQQLWGIKTLAQLAGTWKDYGKLPPRHEEIERLMQ